MKLFGNSLSFMNWSSFNQWYPGSAVTSDPFDTTVGDALSNTGGPNYSMGSYYDPAHGQTIGWNGNFYDATMSSPVNHLSGDYTRGQIFSTPGTVGNTYPQSGITPFYGNSFVNGNISKMLIWDDPTNFAGAKSYRFGSYMGKAYSILGNDYLSRVRNCSWRVVPRIGNEYGDGIGETEPTTVKNNNPAIIAIINVIIPNMINKKTKKIAKIRFIAYTNIELIIKANTKNNKFIGGNITLFKPQTIWPIILINKHKTVKIGFASVCTLL
jgi:hypothetical protein